MFCWFNLLCVKKCCWLFLIQLSGGQKSRTANSIISKYFNITNMPLLFAGLLELPWSPIKGQATGAKRQKNFGALHFLNLLLSWKMLVKMKTSPPLSSIPLFFICSSKPLFLPMDKFFCWLLFHSYFVQYLLSISTT